MARPEPGARVRAVAAEWVSRVAADGLSLESVLSEGADQALADPRDLALARALAHGALRWHPRLDWQARALLHRPLPERESALAALLRIGLFQLQFLRVPVHAAVAATVAAAPLLGRAKQRGLVNAVLRRFLRERGRLDDAMRGVPEAATAHPAWMLGRLQADWPDAWQGIVDANNAQPPLWLRVNRTRLDREAYGLRLTAAGIEHDAPPEPASALRLATPQPASTLPGYQEGLVSVQDGAAQLAAGYLALAPGLRVLDACAAPGGKCSHMLELCPDLAEVVAVDRDAARLDALRAQCARLGQAPTIVLGDASQPTAWWDGRAFDRILLDAPCSALGVLRRHPDIKLLRREADVASACAAQARLLDALWPLLSPGGRLLYVTCSVLRAENEDQVRGFCSRHADAVPTALMADGPSSRQLLPGEADMDGFYYACLAKRLPAQI